MFNYSYVISPNDVNASFSRCVSISALKSPTNMWWWSAMIKKKQITLHSRRFVVKDNTFYISSRTPFYPDANTEYTSRIKCNNWKPLGRRLCPEIPFRPDDALYQSNIHLFLAITSMPSPCRHFHLRISVRNSVKQSAWTSPNNEHKIPKPLSISRSAFGFNPPRLGTRAATQELKIALFMRSFFLRTQGWMYLYIYSIVSWYTNKVTNTVGG